MPAIFAGFRISAGLAVIGAIVGDFFFRQGQPGIGKLIDNYRSRLESEQLFGAIILSSLLGLVVFWIFGFIGNRVVGSWHESAAQAELTTPRQHELFATPVCNTNKEGTCASPPRQPGSRFRWPASCSSPRAGMTAARRPRRRAGVRLRPRWRGGHHRRRRGDNGRSRGRRDIARQRVPCDRRRPDRLEPRGGARRAVQAARAEPDVDTDKKIVTGELTASGGVDTGVKIEIRVGGPAIGFQQVTAQMYTDDSILLGYVSTDEQCSTRLTSPRSR